MTANITRNAFIKLIILLFIVIVSFFIFSELLNIPYQDTKTWFFICWGFVNTIIMLLLFFFRDWKLSFKAATQKIHTFKAQHLITKIILIIDLILNAICITFFIYIGFAYLTMFFAEKPFLEKRQVVEILCKDSLGGPYSPLPAFTKINFLDVTNQNKMTLIFRGNICHEAPAITNYLPGKMVTLRGREWFFGKFYDKIDRQ